MCLTIVNTATDYLTAPRAIGSSNGHANSPRLLFTESPSLKNVCGSVAMEHALHGRPMTKQEKRQRPDFRAECNRPKVYRCLRAFLGAFNQQDCYAFMPDEDGLDKCNYQEFSGECRRGDGLE